MSDRPNIYASDRDEAQKGENTLPLLETHHLKEITKGFINLLRRLADKIEGGE